MSFNSAIIIAGLCALVSACTTTLDPNLDLVDSYTYELEQREPFDQPFVSHFKKGNKELVYVAAYHEHKTGTRTFDLVDKVMAIHNPSVVILEGFEYSLGFTPKGLLNNYINSNDGSFYKWGEPAYTAIKAAESGIPFVGGEPDEIEIKEGVLKAGFSAVDLAMFYFVRQVPQFKRNGSLKAKSIEQVYPEYIKRTYSQLGISDSLSFFQFFI